MFEKLKNIMNAFVKKNLKNKFTSDQMIKTDMIHENKAAPLSISGLNRHFQYLEIQKRKKVF